MGKKMCLSGSSRFLRSELVVNAFKVLYCSATDDRRREKKHGMNTRMNTSRIIISNTTGVRCTTEIQQEDEDED